MAVLDSILQLYRKVLFVDWKMAFNVIAVKKKNAIGGRIGIVKLFIFVTFCKVPKTVISYLGASLSVD